MIIEAERLTKFYGLVIGVNDITLKVPPGIHGLLGPNGAGKSTFLKLITGQLRPSAGRLRVLGRPVWANTQLYRDIGYCPEQDAFYTYMTGLEFVTLLCRLHGFSYADARTRAVKVIEQVGMAQAMDRKIAEYSKGMRQRIKIAQALAHDPKLLILDEPFTGTDPVARRQLADLILDRARGGTSVLIASHILHEIEAITENFVLIFRGRVLASGSTHEIRDLMNEFPHRITLRCSDAKKLGEVLVRRVSLAGLEFDGQADKMTVLVHDPRSFYDRMPTLVQEAGVQMFEMSSQDDNLEAVFQYLMGSQ